MNQQHEMLPRQRTYEDDVEPLRLVILHEDPVTNLLAQRVIDRVAGTLASEFAFVRHDWTFDALATRRALREAIDGARMADIVVISAYRDGDWPEPFQRWIEAWGGESANEGGSLAALMVGRPLYRTRRSNRLEFLETLARTSGRDFLESNVDLEGLDAELFIEPLNHRADRTSSLLNSLMQFPGHYPFQREFPRSPCDY